MTTSKARSINHPHWQGLDDVTVDRKRYGSPLVSLDYVPANTPMPERLTITMPYAAVGLWFSPTDICSAMDGEPITRKRLAHRSHFIAPGATIQLYDLQPTTEMIVLVIDPGFARRSVEVTVPIERSIIGDAKPGLLALGHMVRHRIHQGHPLTPLELESFAVLSLGEWALDLKTMPARRVSRFLPEFDHVDQYIRTHLDQDISLNDLAKIAGLSAGYFLRAFKATTHQTPLRYVMQLRLEKARQLLSDTDKTIAEIAYGCGFASQSHMTDVFRRQMKISPNRYRRSAKSAVTITS